MALKTNEEPPYKMAKTTELIHLPDDCLLHIASFVDATDKYNLSRTCKRWEYIIETPNLWKVIDARRAPNSLNKITYCLEKIYNETNWIGLCSDDNGLTILPNNFFDCIQFLNLTVLAIENQIIDLEVKDKNGSIRRLTVNDFPHTLEELSLKRTSIANSTNFFSHSKDSMKKLRVLILDECQWFVTSMFMPLVKYENLEILSLYKCRQVTDQVAYCSFAALGFTKLKIFDGRLTKLGNTVMKVLCKSQSILAIYLQNQDVSYKLDYFKRKLALLQGAKSIGHYDVDEFDLDDPLIDEFQNTLYESQVLCDYGFLGYHRCNGILNNNQQLPKSVLYHNPYNECTCHYHRKVSIEFEKHCARKNIGLPACEDKPYYGDTSSEDDDDDDNDDDSNNNRITRILNIKVRKLRNLIRKNRKLQKFGNRRLYNQNYPLPVDSSQKSTFDLVPHEEVLNSADIIVVDPGSYEYGYFDDIRRFRLFRSIQRRRPSNDDDDGEDEGFKPKRSRRNNSSSNNEEPQPGPSNVATTTNEKSKSTKEDDPQEGPSGVNGLRFNSPIRLEDKAQRPPTPRPVIVATLRTNHQARLQHNNDFENLLQNVVLGRVVNISVPIKYLSLRGFSKITDQTLECLKNLDLRLIDLTYTKVTVDAILRFLSFNPGCRVVHEAFCVCPTNLHF